MMVEKNNHRRRRSQVYSAELFLSHKLTHTFPWFFTIPFLIPILRPSYDQKCVLSLSSFIAPSLFTLSHSGSGPHCRAFLSLSLYSLFPFLRSPKQALLLHYRYLSLSSVANLIYLLPLSSTYSTSSSLLYPLRVLQRSLIFSLFLSLSLSANHPNHGQLK